MPLRWSERLSTATLFNRWQLRLPLVMEVLDGVKNVFDDCGSGMAGGWIRNFVDNFSDRIKIIGLADVLPDVLAQQGEVLGLSENQLFADFNEACATVKADFCGVAVPPPFHSPRSDRCDGERNAGDLRKADRGYA